MLPLPPLLLLLLPSLLPLLLLAPLLLGSTHLVVRDLSSHTQPVAPPVLPLLPPLLALPLLLGSTHFEVRDLSSHTQPVAPLLLEENEDDDDDEDDADEEEDEEEDEEADALLSTHVDLRVLSSQTQEPPLLLALDELEALLVSLPSAEDEAPPSPVLKHDGRWLHLGCVGAPGGQGTWRQRAAITPRLSSASFLKAV